MGINKTGTAAQQQYQQEEMEQQPGPMSQKDIWITKIRLLDWKFETWQKPGEEQED